MTPGAVLLDEELNEIGTHAGALGILAFRGILPKGYHGDPEKTAQAFPTIRGHRYVMPGDWARATAPAASSCWGASAPWSTPGGEKVFPGEVEETLLAHPAVDDAIVFGLPDDAVRRGRERRWSPPRAGQTLDIPSLLGFLEQPPGRLQASSARLRARLAASHAHRQGGARPASKKDAARELARGARRTRVGLTAGVNRPARSRPT